MVLVAEPSAVPGTDAGVIPQVGSPRVAEAHSCKEHLGAGASGEAEPPRRQIVFFVRHAESRWNRAQAEYGLVSMMWENDHGLSDEGRGQAEGLRARLRGAFAGEVREVPHGASEECWLAALLRPDVVYSSPFTRALQTAVIGLKDILPGGRELVVMREAREQKNLGGADSTGVATGTDISTRLEEELRGLYEASCPLEQAEAAVQQMREVRLDTSGVTDEWWGPLTGDAEGALAERILGFVERLRWTRGCAAGDGGGAAVVVGHSLFFRTIFSTFITRPEQVPLVGVAASLQTRLMPYCGVVGVRFEWDPSGRPRIVEAVPLVGTELTPADYDGLRGAQLSHYGGCVCGRGKAGCTVS